MAISSTRGGGGARCRRRPWGRARRRRPAAVEAAVVVVAAGAAAVAGGGASRDPTDADREAAGFGVRVIHSGVWGFASSPMVTEDEIKRITGIAAEVAKASAIAKKADLKLAPVQEYIENYVTPMEKDPTKMSAADKQAWAQAIVDKASRGERRDGRDRVGDARLRMAILRLAEGSYIEQELFTTTP